MGAIQRELAVFDGFALRRKGLAGRKVPVARLFETPPEAPRAAPSLDVSLDIQTERVIHPTTSCSANPYTSACNKSASG